MDIFERTYRLFGGTPEIKLQNVPEVLEEVILHNMSCMCDTVLLDASIPFIIEEGTKDTIVITPRGLEKLGDRPYNYAIARTKDTKERLNIITYNSEPEYFLYFMIHIAMALGDITSFQLEEAYLKTELKDELHDVFTLVRSASAMSIAYLALNSLERDEMKIIFEHKYNEIFLEHSFEDFIENKNLSFEDKVVILTELMAIWFVKGKSIKTEWKSNHIAFKTVTRIEEALYNIFKKLKINSEFYSNEEKERLDNLKQNAILGYALYNDTENGEEKEYHLQNVVEFYNHHNTNLVTENDILNLKETVEDLNNIL